MSSTEEEGESCKIWTRFSALEDYSVNVLLLFRSIVKDTYFCYNLKY